MLAQLGVGHIAAYSPQARRRSERLFATLQDRMEKELLLDGVTTVADADRFLRDVYTPAHSARLTMTHSPQNAGSAILPPFHSGPCGAVGRAGALAGFPVAKVAHNLGHDRTGAGGAQIMLAVKVTKLGLP